MAHADQVKLTLGFLAIEDGLHIGIELARTALFQAATCALLHDPDMKAVFDRKKAEGKFYLVCVSHVMRIQLRRLVAVLYDRQPFVRAATTISVNI